MEHCNEWVISYIGIPKVPNDRRCRNPQEPGESPLESQVDRQPPFSMKQDQGVSPEWCDPGHSGSVFITGEQANPVTIA